MSKGIVVVRGLVFAVVGIAYAVSSPAADVVSYYHLDAIGNVRAMTDQAGQVIERHDYLPFGEECLIGPCAGSPGAGLGQTRKFTGKERDQETGLDYFGARYYGAKIARFTTTDPVYTWKQNLVDPQRWNRYGYGRNNPLRFVDPDGRQVTPEPGSLAWIIDQFNRATSNYGAPNYISTVPVQVDKETVKKAALIATAAAVIAGIIDGPEKEKLHPKKERTLDGAQDQMESIEHQQRVQRKAGKDKIDSTKKSEQNLKTELKKVKSSEDLKSQE